MASRKEEKERLRAQRLAAERSAGAGGRRRLMAGYVVAGILTVAVIAGLVAVIASGGGGGGGGTDACDNAHIQNSGGTFRGLEPDCRQGTNESVSPTQFGDLAVSAQKAGCQLKEDLPDEGNTHVPNSTPVHYGTVPPTSGNHNPVPIDDGAYTTQITSDTNQETNIRNEVHAMEHGRIEIHYTPKLPEDQQLALKACSSTPTPTCPTTSRSPPGPTRSSARITTQSCSTWSGTSATSTAATVRSRASRSTWVRPCNRGGFPPDAET
jgi:hypothetical protein